jgi:hypothetical protein
LYVSDLEGQPIWGTIGYSVDPSFCYWDGVFIEAVLSSEVQFYPLAYGDRAQVEAVLEEPGGRVVDGYGWTVDHDEGNWAIWRGTGGAVSGRIDSVEVRAGKVRVGLGGDAVAHDWLGWIFNSWGGSMEGWYNKGSRPLCTEGGVKM